MGTTLHLDTPMPLRVARIEDVAVGIRSFELVQPDGTALPPFTPGSHVRVQTPSGALRKYSLCNDPAETHRYLIAVKREEAGRGGSASMHEQLREGDLLPTSLPENAFPLAGNAKAYLFIAGGIGITPILAMIRSLGELPQAPWKLLYLGRDRAAMAFADALSEPGLKPRVRIHDDGGDPARALDLWPFLEKPNSAHLYCCGPRGLMEAVRDMTGHWSTANVHFESFNDGGGVKPDDRPFQVKLARTGLACEIPVGRSILEVLREHGCTVASSCESGTCGTCRTALLAGEADHRDMVLMPDEMQSQVMICVSRARSAELVLDL
jgi:phthalate 4,5-dioxygenase reductase subunit